MKETQVSRYLLLLIATALVFYALFRADPFPDYFMYSDKVGHFAAFFLLFSATYWLIHERFSVVYMLAVLIILAVGSEYVQGTELLPDRHFGIADIMANVAGVIVGLVLMMSLKRSYELKL